MNLILFDTKRRTGLFPLTANKAIADLRFGILSIKERWEKLTGLKAFVLTENLLQALYEPIVPGEAVFIDASVIPSPELVQSIVALEPDESINDSIGLVAGRKNYGSVPAFDEVSKQFSEPAIVSDIKRLTLPNQLFLWNDEMINFDFLLVTKGNQSLDLNESVQKIKTSKIFVEEDAVVNHCILNASTGPIYIGKNATIMEGCFIRGPFAMGEGAVLKMGSKIYGATTIGPGCTAGGEIKNSILMGYSNKAHEGYLGDSVIGEWCNMGAGTSNSNVKNTASEVRLWNYETKSYINAGLKCGMIMGDYSRTAINTSINTGTVVGISCNIFGNGLTPKFIPDFSWGLEGNKRYDFDKAFTDINNWKKLKNKMLSDQERQVLKLIFETHQ